jgi:hypothetical protein
MAAAADGTGCVRFLSTAAAPIGGDRVISSTLKKEATSSSETWVYIKRRLNQFLYYCVTCRAELLPSNVLLHS